MIDEHLAAGPPARSRNSLPPAPTQRSYVLVIAVVLGLLVIIASALYTFRSPGVATLRVTTEPKDAIVTVDGARISGSSSPFIIDGLEAGKEHTVAVEKQGYKAWSTKIAVHGDKVLDLPPVVLDKQISALPEPPADDPEPAARREPGGAAKPAASSKPAATTPRTKPTQAVTKREPPPPSRTKPAPAAVGGKGSLRINTRPWSQVFVDGKNMGNTPQMNIPLSAGTHKLRLVNPDFKLTKTLTIEIVPGQTLTKVLTLE